MSYTPEPLTGTSMDIPTENRARLKQLFPTVFTEIRNDEGELVESVDFERLKAELGTFTDLFESRRERYGMDWPGKKDALRLIQTPSAATLKPCREESVNFDSTENLFIEGDNLEVLKLLQKSYYGKVKMIYIDPPYNTGKEFIYPDNFKENLDTYLEYAGLIDGDGKKFSTNTANEGRFHTKWLNMMYPRLYLARNLLRDDGVIFISIDDNEVNNLRKLCDEIFGEDGFVACVVWKHTQQSKNDERHFSRQYNSLIVYAKIKDCLENFNFPRTVKDNKNYSNPDNDPRGDWRPGDVRSPNYRRTLCYDIIAPNGQVLSPPANGWRWSKEEINRKTSTGEIKFSDDGTRIIRKIYLADQEGRTPENIWEGEEYGTTRGANSELKDLFNGEALFDTPKPTQLVKKVMELFYQEKDCIVLDFFAGSATSAHAIIDLNKQDNGNRKFILVQLPEPCPPDSEAFKAGYKTISDIGKERIRRVIKKFAAEQAGELPFDDVSSKDLGFKVLKLDKSNFKQWQKLDPTTPPEKIEKQLELFVEHIEPKATQEDLLYEILIKAGFMPTTKISILELKDGKLSGNDEKTSPQPSSLNVFSVENGALLLCLEKTITKELIDAVADCEPMQFICLDAAFNGNDQLKANAVQTFAARNMQREKHNQIVFKTV